MASPFTANAAQRAYVMHKDTVMQSASSIFILWCLLVANFISVQFCLEKLPVLMFSKQFTYQLVNKEYYLIVI